MPVTIPNEVTIAEWTYTPWSGVEVAPFGTIAEYDAQAVTPQNGDKVIPATEASQIAIFANNWDAISPALQTLFIKKLAAGFVVA